MRDWGLRDLRLSPPPSHGQNKLQGAGARRELKTMPGSAMAAMEEMLLPVFYDNSWLTLGLSET